MPYKYPFLEILAELDQHNIHPILVGGWVPTVYFEYLWKTQHKNIPTKDIDFAISAHQKTKIPIEKVLTSTNYTHRHLKTGHLKPYQLIFQGKVPIDFLADKKHADYIHQLVVGKGLLLNVMTEYDFLLDDCISVCCDKLTIKVPAPERYILHKLQVYLERPKTRKKDLAMAYFVLSRSSEQDNIIKKAHKLRSNNTANKIIKKLFQKQPTPTSDFVSDIINSLSIDFGIIEEPSTIVWYLKELNG
jgi:hypothetical protein